MRGVSARRASGACEEQANEEKRQSGDGLEFARQTGFAVNTFVHGHFGHSEEPPATPEDPGV